MIESSGRSGSSVPGVHPSKIGAQHRLRSRDCERQAPDHRARRRPGRRLPALRLRPRQRTRPVRARGATPAGGVRIEVEGPAARAGRVRAPDRAPTRRRWPSSSRRRRGDAPVAAAPASPSAPPRGGPARTLVSPGRRHLRRLPGRTGRPGATAATGTRSSPARTAVRASPSSPPCPTTGPTPPWPASRCAPDCAREYADPADRRFHAQPSPAPPAARACGCARPGRPDLDRRDGRRSPRPARLLGGRRDPRGQGSRRLPPGLRRRRRRRGRAAAPAQGPRRQAVRRDGPRPRRRPSTLGARRPGGAGAAHRRRAARSCCCAAAGAERRARGSPRAVAPGSPDLGVMLPYTPLHHLLLGLPGDPPGPRAARHDQRQRRPASRSSPTTTRRWSGWPRLADAWLTHDRPIHVPCDDSVVRVVRRRAAAGAPLPRLRAAAGRPAGAGAPGARRRRRPEEHLLPRRRAATPGCRRTSATWTTSPPCAPSSAPTAQLERSPACVPRSLAADRHPGYRSRRLGRAARRRPAGAHASSTTTPTSPPRWPSTASTAAAA